MESVIKLALYLVILSVVGKESFSSYEEKKLSRRRRYIVFPEGATLTVSKVTIKVDFV